VATATPVSEVSTPPPARLPGSQATAAELERRRRLQTRVRWELLDQLVRKDLKVKYQNSVLGFIWSLLNPLFTLIVYVFVFTDVFHVATPYFSVYLMSGLLLWNLFVGSVMSATGSVVGNAALVKKVRFPLSVLPLSSVGFALVHYVLQMAVFLVVLAVTGVHFWGIHLLFFFPALGVGILFAVALSFLVAALNVRYRDTQHLVEILLFAWFYLTPCVYAAGLMLDAFKNNNLVFRIFFSDPIAAAIASMQRAFYPSDTITTGKYHVLAARGYAWYCEQLAVGAIVSLLLLWFSRSLFRRMQADFAEEL
jgi:ABC-2 type transport system permease protein